MPEPSRTEDTCLRAALAYLARGWSVVPAAERGKRIFLSGNLFGIGGDFYQNWLIGSSYRLNDFALERRAD